MSEPRPDARRSGGGRRKAESARVARRRERAEQRLREAERRQEQQALQDDRRRQEQARRRSTDRARQQARASEAGAPAATTVSVDAARARQADAPARQADAPTKQPAAATRRGGPASAALTESSPPPAGHRVPRALAILGLLLWAGGVVAAALGFAERQDWLAVEDVVPRVGAVTATWVAIVVLTRRSGGRPVLVGIFAAGLLGLAAAFPENWALAGAAVVTATTYGLLGALLTRPAPGLRALRELLIAVFIGLVGAAVVSGYDVSLRTLRFRVLVLAAVLVCGFALAWRLGHGAKSLGRRGVVLILTGALLIAVSILYARAISEWGSPDVVHGMRDTQDWLHDHLGAVPRPVEAIVGFPTLMWGVAIRARRRQGWWMCAFGALGVTGVVTAFVQRGAELGPTLAATGYNVVIGAVLGLLLIGVDRLLTGTGRRSRAGDADVDRPEPARFAPLL